MGVATLHVKENNIDSAIIWFRQTDILLVLLLNKDLSFIYIEEGTIYVFLVSVSVYII